jgi:hypothetical protein
MQEEEPDEAAKYFQQLVRDYPNSQFVDKAKDQLNIIGAAIPEPDPIKKSLPPPCDKPTFMQNMMQQIAGSANVTTDKNGILITRHGDGTDLIDKAIQNNGQLPEGVQPSIQRSTPTQTPSGVPARTTTPQSSTSNTTTDPTRPRLVPSPTPKP